MSDEDVELLCNKLRREKYGFSEQELQEVRKSLLVCQYRKGKDFRLCLKPTSQNPRPEQHTSVKKFVEHIRRR